MGGHTIRLLPLWRRTRPDLPTLFQVDVPVRRLSLCVLERECEDGAAFLYRVFPFRIVREG
jgi:hypothetical protein